MQERHLFPDTHAQTPHFVCQMQSLIKVDEFKQNTGLTINYSMSKASIFTLRSNDSIPSINFSNKVRKRFWNVTAATYVVRLAPSWMPCSPTWPHPADLSPGAAGLPPASAQLQTPLFSRISACTYNTCNTPAVTSRKRELLMLSNVVVLKQ
jgi:hypothetical protein